MSTFKKIRFLLTRQERRRGYLLLCMILVMALLDTIGVASIMPFMAVLGNPEIVETNRWLALVYDRLGFEDTRSFLLFLGGAVFIALVVSGAFRALTQWALLRFTHMRKHSLSCRLFRGYLGRPYIWFLNRHSADLGKTILSEVQQVVKGVLVPGMQLLGQGSVALCLVILLVIVDPLLALIASLTLGGSYLLIYVAIRSYLSRIGKDRVLANRERYQAAQEALGGIKEVKISGREKAFFKRFTGPSLRFAKHQANNQIASQLPRYIMEVAAFGGILLLTLYLFTTRGDFGRVLPVLGVYAFAGYRLLPAMQNLYSHIAELRFGIPALDHLLKDIVDLDDAGMDHTHAATPPLVPQHSVALRNVRFTYPGVQAPVLKNISLDVPVNAAVGLVGSTGSGKTTLVDVILGLLHPDEGQLLVDKTPITEETLRSWQRSLGYVAQHIYLADDTVAANIAFGIPPGDIDRNAVERAARIAELHEFVTTELPKGYDTLVGERGVRLSGGERQRIGIARALYHDPPVLIMDEATSSLDNLTEQYVIQAIKRMKGQRTIILIAHRLSTVRDCDMIVFLDHGEIAATGTYTELVAGNEEFRKMAGEEEPAQTNVHG